MSKPTNSSLKKSNSALVKIIKDLTGSGIKFDDPDVDYVVMQIYRKTLTDARVLIDGKDVEVATQPETELHHCIENVQLVWQCMECCTQDEIPLRSFVAIGNAVCPDCNGYMALMGVVTKGGET